MDTLLCTIRNFRNAIDKAKMDRRFDSHVVFENFPVGCCGITSTILGVYLLEKGVHVRYVYGTYRDSNAGNRQTHAWLILDNDTIIDITGDQFKYDELFYYNSKNVYIGEENEFYRLFEIDFPPHEIGRLDYDERIIYSIIKEYL